MKRGRQRLEETMKHSHSALSPKAFIKAARLSIFSFGILSAALPALAQDTVRITRNVYNDAGLLLREIAPEGNASEYSYDVRGNRLTSCVIAKGRVDWDALVDEEAPQCDAGVGDLLTQTFYVGGPTLQYYQCASLKTCNKVSHVIDPKGNRSNMTWSSVHGGVLTEKSGLTPAGACSIAGGLCPEKTYGYGSYTGTDGSTFYLVTSVTEKVDASRTITTRYEYNTANKFVLKSRIVEGDGAPRRTCYSFDAIGNLLSTTEPKGTGASCP